MRKTTGWLKSHAIPILETLLDIVQQSRLASDIIQLRISTSVDTMARTYFF